MVTTSGITRNVHRTEIQRLSSRSLSLVLWVHDLTVLNNDSITLIVKLLGLSNPTGRAYAMYEDTWNVEISEFLVETVISILARSIIHVVLPTGCNICDHGAEPIAFAI